jgi:periplasmic protein CpxP/Spy
MSYFNRHKWWLIAVVVLIVINTATLTIFWMERKSQNLLLATHAKGANAQAFLVKELLLDSVQQEQYLQLVKAHRESTMAIKKDLKNAKDAFFMLISDTTVSEATIKTEATKVSTVEAQLDILTFKHFKQVRNICTPQQKIKFDSIIESVVKMMGPNQQQRPKRPPRGNGEGERAGGPPEEGNGPPAQDGQRPPRN